MSLLRENQALFSYDATTQFLYDWRNGTYLYKSKRYTDARPYLAKAISFFEENPDELKEVDSSWLSIYLFAIDVDKRSGASKKELIKGYEHAKHVYEVAGAMSDGAYSKITSDLNDLKGPILPYKL